MSGQASRIIGTVAGLALLPVCGPKTGDPIPEDAAERYAEAVCSTVQRCGCLGESLAAGEGDALSTEQACLGEAARRFDRVASWPGTKFDAECFEQVLAAIEGDECGDATAWKPLPCLVFEGGRGRGESCTHEWSPSWRNGQAGLLAAGECGETGACYDGTCGPVEVTVARPGEPCHLALGAVCAQGAYCSSDGTCKLEVGPGDPCDTPDACANGSETYCAGLDQGAAVGQCEPKIPIGESCDTQAVQPCAELGYCGSDGICRPHWPQACFHLAGPPRDFYWKPDWVPWDGEE